MSPRTQHLARLAAGPMVAIATTIAALIATSKAGVRFRDPDHVAAGYVAMVGGAVFLLVGLDIAFRAGRQERTWRPSRAALGRVRRERWTAGRSAGVAVALLSFYATYLAYRNLKAVVPLLRPGELFDGQLAALDRRLLGGHDPASVLHTLLGTGIPTHVLSTIYVAFIVFLPLSLAVALVFVAELRTSLLYAAALSINWILGAASYFVLPSLGPAYADPASVAGLPHSEVTHLQQVLLDQRIGFLHDPATGTPQSIAAFASLHIAMSFTAVLSAHLFGAGRRLKIALWTWLLLTGTATVYLGWHYVVDDLAGLGIGAVSLGLAVLLTGSGFRGQWRARGLRRARREPAAVGAGGVQRVLLRQRGDAG
jgi:hypothetical protein